MTVRLVGLLCLAGLMLQAGPLMAADVTVTFQAESSVKGPRVLLGDIASVEVLTAAGELLADQIKRIDLGPSPTRGQVLTWRQPQLEQRIMAAKLNLAEAVFQMPPEIKIKSDGQSVDEETLKRVVMEYLADTEPYRSGRYELLSFSAANTVNLPSGELTYRFVPQASSNPTYLAGQIYFSIGGKEVGRARVTGQVELYVNALVATRPLNRGHIVTDDDLSLTQVPYSQARDALLEPDVVIGSTIKSNIGAGDPIKERYLTKSLMVRRGEMVTIIAQSGPLRVTASGQSKQDGALGDTVSVLNLDSKKTLSGKVIGPSKVEVLF